MLRLPKSPALNPPRILKKKFLLALGTVQLAEKAVSAAAVLTNRSSYARARF